MIPWTLILHSKLLAGDIKQAFLHIVISEIERDSMRFLWVNDLQHKETALAWRYSEMYAQKYPKCVEQLTGGIDIHDINIVGDTVEETQVIKEQAKERSREATRSRGDQTICTANYG